MTTASPSQNRAELIVYARWLAGGLTGLSVAGVFTIVGAGLSGDGPEFSLTLFALSIPFLLQYLTVVLDPRRTGKMTRITKLCVFVGILASGLGFVILIWFAFPLAGAVITVSTVLAFLAVAHAQRARQAEACDRSDVTSTPSGTGARAG